MENVKGFRFQDITYHNINALVKFDDNIRYVLFTQIWETLKRIFDLSFYESYGHMTEI